VLEILTIQTVTTDGMLYLLAQQCACGLREFFRLHIALKAEFHNTEFSTQQTQFAKACFNMNPGRKDWHLEINDAGKIRLWHLSIPRFTDGFRSRNNN
jgi:hypothetical protein